MADREREGGTALFVTALELEADAVASHLHDLGWKDHPGGSVYRTGWWAGTRARWQVVIVEADMGPEDAAAATTRAVDWLAPPVAFFVGVAGGLKDVEIGDVVVASEVIGFEYGKDGADFKPRGPQLKSAFRLTQLAKRVRTERRWQARVEPPADGRKALIAPIAAGSKVVADSRSPSAQLLRSKYSQAVAVEMEGLGFLQGAFQAPTTKAIVVRGISDLLDGKAEADAQGNQPRAAEHAAAFAFELLDLLPGELDNLAEPAIDQQAMDQPPPVVERLVFVSRAPELLDPEDLGERDTIGRHRERKRHLQRLTTDLADSLAPSGYRLWLPDEDSYDGERVDPAAMTCDLAVVLIDRDALTSERMAQEATVLLWQCRLGLPVLPVLLGDVTRSLLQRSPLGPLATQAMPLLALTRHTTNSAIRATQVEAIHDAVIATAPWTIDNPTRRWINDVARFISAVPDSELPRLAGYVDVPPDELRRTGDPRATLARSLMGSDVESVWHFMRDAAEYLDREAATAVVKRVTPIWVDLESAKLVLDVADLPDGARVCGFETSALRLGEHIVRRATASAPEYTAVPVPEIAGEDPGHELFERYETTLCNALNLFEDDRPATVAEKLAGLHAAVFVLLRCTDMNPQVTSNLLRRLGERFPGIAFVLLAERNSAIWRGVRGIRRSPRRWTQEEEREARRHVSRLHGLIGDPIMVDSDE